MIRLSWTRGKHESKRHTQVSVLDRKHDHAGSPPIEFTITPEITNVKTIHHYSPNLPAPDRLVTAIIAPLALQSTI
jgi:hypothetical protein